MESKYYKDRRRKYDLKLDENKCSLPQLCVEYLEDIELARSPSYLATTSSHLKSFFTWLYNQDENHKDPTNYTADDLSSIKSGQITRFIKELRDNGDKDNTLQMYLSSISAFYKHMNKKGRLEENPMNAIVLKDDDYDRYSSTVANGVGLSKHELQYREAIGSAERDILIVSLLVNTGIRISELVGLDLESIDRKAHKFTVIRKGGDETNVYYADEIDEYLDNYLPKRAKILAEGESALLLSFTGKTKGKRIDVRTVQKMIKKYALAAGVSDASKMTPHKLRHTSAMMLLDATGNLALVQKFLGHSNIASTVIYAESQEKDLQNVRNTII